MPETKSKIIHGVSFNITWPYAAGHVLTEAEAKQLNQVRSENIGNNVREKIKELIEAGKQGEAEALVAEKDSTYEFTLHTPGASRTLDPVEREARKMAREILKNLLAQDGKKLTTPPEGKTKEEWDAYIEEKIEEFSANENILKEAKKSVDASKKRMDNLLSGVGL